MVAVQVERLVAARRARPEAPHLSPRELSALLVLRADGPLSVGALARRLGVSLPTASMLSGRLNRGGLVERREDDSNRRRTLVAVTAASEEAVDRLLAPRLDSVRRALARLSAADRIALIHGLRRLSE